MVWTDNDGVKIKGVYWPFAVYEECAGCRFRERVGTVEGEPLDRDICKMTPEIEDKFLFSDMPDRDVPPCMRD